MPKLLFTFITLFCINLDSIIAQNESPIITTKSTLELKNLVNGSIISPTESPIITLWDSISSQDLTMTTYLPDTSAAAVVLTDNGYLSVSVFEQKCVLTTLHRVKILKKSAFDDYGKHGITVRSYEKLIHLRAQTINPDGSRTQVTEFFEEKINDYVKRKKFAFPKLQEGSIVEYEYTIESRNLLELYPWYFQEEIPVRHSELIMNLPPTLEYIFLPKGDRPLQQGLGEVKIKYQVGEKIVASQDSFHRFALDTVEAMKPEGFVTTMTDYVSNLRFQLSKVDYRYVPESKILADWQSLTKEFLEDKSLGQQLSDRGNYKDVWKAVRPLIEKVPTSLEKIRICYEFISKNVNWIDDYFSIYAQETLEDAFKKKKANSGELNMMLIACLNEAGIKAYPMLVSTRDHGQPYLDYPIRQQFNHLLCYVQNGEKVMILDAGNIHRPMDCPRIPSLNGSGFVLDVKNPRWVKIVAPLSTQTVLATCNLSAEGVLSGNINESHNGYSAVNERTNLKDDDKSESVKKAWANTFPDIQVDSIVLMNKDSLHLPFKRSMSFTLPNAAIVAGDLLYIKPTLKTDFDESFFKQPTRNYPIDMPNPIRDNFILNMTLPEGFDVEELPKEEKVSLQEGAASYIYSCTKTGSNLQLRIRIDIKKLHFEKEEYTAVKQFFDHIAAKQAEQIVLKRKEVKK